MAEHTFNLQAFITEMGLKRVSEFPIREVVQPVVTVGDFSSLTPAHVPPTAAFGRLIPAVIGQTCTVEVHSLGPGGTFILLFAGSAGTFYAFGTGTVATAGLAATPIPQVLSDPLVPVVSTVRDGTVVVPPVTNADRPVITGGQLLQGAPLFIPRGLFFQASVVIANSLLNYAIIVSDVPASEGGD